MQNTIDRIIATADDEPKNLAGLTIKLFEEGGELAEQVNHRLGNLLHKTMKEDIMSEVADVIIVALTIGRKAHPALSDYQYSQLLEKWLNSKIDKWEEKMSAFYGRSPR